MVEQTISENIFAKCGNLGLVIRIRIKVFKMLDPDSYLDLHAMIEY
jgi:hypothetical protein